MTGGHWQPDALLRECKRAIEEHLAGRVQQGLERARKVGRGAAQAGLGLTELAAAYRNAIAAAGMSSGSVAPLLDSALDCLCVSFRPFEELARSATEALSQIQQSRDGFSLIKAEFCHQNQQLAAAREAEEREKARYHALFELAPDGYLVTGIEGAIQEANAAAAALLRTPREMLPGQLFSEFLHKRDRELFRERMREFHRGGIDRIEDWQIELEPRHGPRIPAVLTAAVEPGTAGATGLGWIIRDDTQRRRAESEQAWQLVGHARAEATKRFEFLAEASALLVGSSDIEASLREVARMTADYVGGWCFVHAIDGDGSIRQIASAHADPSAIDLASALSKHCLYGGESRRHERVLPASPEMIEPVTNDWYERIADGVEHSVLLRRLHSRAALILPLKLHGQLLGVLTLFSSVHQEGGFAEYRALCEDLARRCVAALENARLYRQVVAERDRAERASLEKDEFVAILSHELRHSLTPLARWTKLLRDHPSVANDPLLRKAASAMECNAAVLARLISDCGDLSSIAAGKLHLEFRVTDLNEIVRQAAETGAQADACEGLRLITELNPEPLFVKCDPVRLQQVAINLLNNAMKYTAAGGAVTLRTVCAAEHVGFSVSDTGAGIRAELLEEVFEPFRQAADTWLTSPSGLGLGLAIARRIISMHGGEIWAESPGLGQGSTFRVRLPRAAESESPSEQVGFEQPFRILVVEDSPDIRFVLKAELEMSGHEVVTANNGEEGMDAAREHRPDLLISDVKMPVMDGFRMMRNIRADPELHATRAIALTGLGAEVTRALAAGFDICVVKPADGGELAAAIRNLMADRQPRSAAAED